jgi:DNA-binding GntR family transcriptional regulator
VTTKSSDLQTERAHRALLVELRNGKLASGTFLSMPALVERLGMPMAAVREAVKRAETTALVTIMPKRGIMIMDAGPERTRECLDLRAMFDCEGARRIIAEGRHIPLDDLRDKHLRLRDAARAGVTPDLPDRAVKVDLSLHDALATGLGSTLARRLYAENRDRISVIQNTRPFLVDRIASAMDEHLRIIDTLEADDVDAAQVAIRDHLANTLRWWGIAV